MAGRNIGDTKKQEWTFDFTLRRFSVAKCFTLNHRKLFKKYTSKSKDKVNLIIFHTKLNTSNLELILVLESQLL